MNNLGELRMTVKKVAGIQVVYIQRRKKFACINESSLFRIQPLQHLFARLLHLHMRGNFSPLYSVWHVFFFSNEIFI